MRLLLLADTHVPRRARDLPAEVWSAVEAADVVFHAGDWVSRGLVDELAARSARLIGCVGNNDGPEVRAVLPEVARVTLDGLRFVVVHETGPAAGRDRRMAAAYPEADVLVFGHSHIPWDATFTPGGSSGPSGSRGPRPADGSSPLRSSTVSAGPVGPGAPAAPSAQADRGQPVAPGGRSLRLLNPGSPTDRRRQPAATYITARVADGRLTDVVLHALPDRRPAGRTRPPTAGGGGTPGAASRGPRAT